MENSPLPANNIRGIDIREDGLIGISAADNNTQSGIALLNGDPENEDNWTVFNFGESLQLHWQIENAQFDANGDLWVSALSMGVAVLRTGNFHDPECVYQNSGENGCGKICLGKPKQLFPILRYLLKNKPLKSSDEEVQFLCFFESYFKPCYSSLSILFHPDYLSNFFLLIPQRLHPDCFFCDFYVPEKFTKKASGFQLYFIHIGALPLDFCGLPCK